MTAVAGHVLEDGVRGEVVRPGDDDYEAARRVYNHMVDARPAAVVRCTGVDDVVAVVRYAGDRYPAGGARGWPQRARVRHG